MHDLFTEKASAATERYSAFLDVLRSQSDLAMRRDPLNEVYRQEAAITARESARSFLSMQQAWLNDDTAEVARHAHARALSDLELSPRTIDDRFAHFIFSAALYTTQLLSAQVERDVTAMSQHLRIAAQRVDLYVRSGRYTKTGAVTAIMMEDTSAPTFRYVDRLGRRYKATKHIRDIYRLHLLNTHNEVYMDTAAEHGVTHVQVEHPDPAYKWHGAELSIVSGIDDAPLYYDVRDEIFHPGSNAILAFPR
jgi:hypothetical protein